MKKNKIDKEALLLEAKNRLEKTSLKDEIKKDIDFLLSLFRPEHMKSKKFDDECKKAINKYIDLSKNDKYDEYEKEVINNTAGRFYEFQMKAYLTLCYYN